jgi:AAA domain
MCSHQSSNLLSSSNTKYLCFFAESITLVRDSRSPARLIPKTEHSTPKALDYVQLVKPLERIPKARIGTVDKFQGQEAPVVIYSLTTSSPEDAPRGMEFLYSLNRLNVATSRAQAVVIVVGSPRLLEPECRSPRQMQLANALCRYAEMAQVARDATIGAKRRVLG